MTSVRAMAELDILKGLQSVRERINAVCIRNSLKKSPRLVAVSKTKPIDTIMKCYQAGQRNFGENYIQELVEKGNDPKLQEVCSDIKWHFIGHLQRNKINKLLSIPGLYIVETVDSDKLANSLDSAWGKMSKSEPLKIMVQVNTSGESEKSGCSPEDIETLVEHILKKCLNLKLIGLMTIGQFGYDCSKAPNPDFLCLKTCRNKLCEKLHISISDIELSMGMSDDFEHAIELGSTNVRVGSSIFGARSKNILPSEIDNATQGMENISTK